MKTRLIAALLAAGPAAALAGIPVGRGEVSASVSAAAIYDSNVFGTHDATADFSGSLTPRLVYNRTAGAIEAEASAGVTFIQYVDQTQLNASNIDADARLQIAEADFRNYSGSLSAGYHESSDVNADVNARIQSNVATFIARSAFVTGPRTDLALSVNYSDARREGASDQQILTTEVLYDYKDFFYGNSLRLVGDYDTFQSSGDNAADVPLDQNSYTFSAGLGRAFYHDNLHAGISYGYRVLNRSAAESLDGETRRAGPVITASLEGPFLPAKYFPKVKSAIALSYQDAATPGINDTGAHELTGSLSAVWQARPATSVSFSARRDQRLSVDDLSVVTTGGQLGLDQTLRPNLTATLNAGYDWSSFDNLAREDKTISFAARFKYRFARIWSADLSYLYNSTDSTLRESTFDRQLVSLKLTCDF